MNAILRNTATAPLPRENLDRLNAVVTGYDREQLIWSSGYLAGLASASAGTAPLVPAPDSNAVEDVADGAAEDSWTIFYATETGNSRQVAESIRERARSNGVATELQDLVSVRPRALAKLRRALFVVATHGIGEPPAGTEPFFEYWLGDKAPRLPQLMY